MLILFYVIYYYKGSIRIDQRVCCLTLTLMSLASIHRWWRTPHWTRLAVVKWPMPSCWRLLPNPLRHRQLKRRTTTEQRKEKMSDCGYGHWISQTTREAGRYQKHKLNLMWAVAQTYSIINSWIETIEIEIVLTSTLLKREKEKGPFIFIYKTYDGDSAFDSK